MSTTSVTSGPQIQDFKVRNAIDQITTGLNAAEAAISINGLAFSTGFGRELLSTNATAASQTIFPSAAATGVSLNLLANSKDAVAQAVVDIVDALRTAKLMR